MPQVVDILENCPPSEHAWPFGLFIKGQLPHGRDFLRFAKFGTLQYSVITVSYTHLTLPTKA